LWYAIDSGSLPAVGQRWRSSLNNDAKRWWGSCFFEANISEHSGINKSAWRMAAVILLLPRRAAASVVRNAAVSSLPRLAPRGVTAATAVRRAMATSTRTLQIPPRVSLERTLLTGPCPIEGLPALEGTVVTEQVLVTPQWLHERLDKVVVYDCSWYLPVLKRDVRAEYRDRRIPVRSRNRPAARHCPLSSGRSLLVVALPLFEARGRTRGPFSLTSTRSLIRRRPCRTCCLPRKPLALAWVHLQRLCRGLHRRQAKAPYSCSALLCGDTGQDGVRRDEHVVVYDSSGISSACRVYWTFKVCYSYSVHSPKPNA